MKLKNVDSLRNDRRGRDAWGRVGHPAVNYLVDVTLAPHKARRVRTEREIRPDGADRSSISDPESERMHGVGEVLQIPLPETQAHVLQLRIHIAEIVKQHASQVVADERKPKLNGVVKQRIPADRESSVQVARTSLEIGKRAIRHRPAGEEPLGQWNLGKPGIALDYAESGGSRQHQVLGERVIRGVLREQASITCLGAECLRGELNVDSVVDASMGVQRIVAPVLNKGSGKKSYAHRL